MRFFCAFVLVCGMAASAVAQTTPKWSYEGKTGPLNWGKLDPEYKSCSSGHEQSPIDIRGAHLNKSLQPIQYHYMTGTVTLENTGRTILVHVRPGSYILVDGVRYNLEQFHFHHPAEEAVKGRLTDMDVHMVHKSDDGKTVVIAVRLALDRGEPNAVLAALWPHLPKVAGATEKVDEMVNAAGFLPADRGYWTYTGSLTAPPCTEGVRWFIYQEPLSMSLSQVKVISALFPINSRPLQDAHGRKIEANE